MATGLFSAAFFLEGRWLIAIAGPLMSVMDPVFADVLSLEVWVTVRFALRISIAYFLVAGLSWLIRCGRLGTCLAAVIGCRIGLATLTFAMAAGDNPGVYVGPLSKYMLEWPGGFELSVMAASLVAALAGCLKFVTCPHAGV